MRRGKSPDINRQPEQHTMCSSGNIHCGGNLVGRLHIELGEGMECDEEETLGLLHSLVITREDGCTVCLPHSLVRLTASGYDMFLSFQQMNFVV